jgi:hypothetical protein
VKKTSPIVVQQYQCLQQWVLIAAVLSLAIIVVVTLLVSGPVAVPAVVLSVTGGWVKVVKLLNGA